MNKDVLEAKKLQFRFLKEFNLYNKKKPMDYVYFILWDKIYNLWKKKKEKNYSLDF